MNVRPIDRAHWMLLQASVRHVETRAAHGTR